MTRNIVQADIDLVRQLIEADCTDSGIVACLCWRGVASDKAAELVESLWKGQRIQPQLPLAEPKVPQNLPNTGAKNTNVRRKSAHPVVTRRGIKKLVNWSLFITVVVLFLGSVVYVGIYAVREFPLGQAGKDAEEERALESRARRDAEKPRQQAPAKPAVPTSP